MIRTSRLLLLGAFTIPALVSAACTGAKTSAATLSEPAAIAVRAVTLQNEPIDRFLRVTGSLMADEQAEVAAETAGRVIATPVERGTRVAAGTVLVRISGTEADAQLREAEANASQIEARLGLTASQPFDPIHVPEVMNAKASLDWAEAEFNRIKSLLDQRVVSQSEYRAAADASPGGATAIPGGAERRAAVVPIARRRPRPHRPGAQGVGGHVGPGAVCRPRRRAPREHRRLRDKRNQGRHGGEDRSSPRRADSS